MAELKLRGRAEAMAWKHGDNSKVLMPQIYLDGGRFSMQATQLRTYFWHADLDIGWSVPNDATMGVGDTFVENVEPQPYEGLTNPKASGPII